MRKVRIFFILLFLLIFVGLQERPKYYLSVCAIFRNEARFLKEWIEYHKMIGVEHFYLLNHLSEDDFNSVLKPYLEDGIVELFEWPFEVTHHKQWNKIQCNAYNKILSEKGKETFWLAVIDTDEFILPLKTTSLSKFLKEYESFGGLAINWQLFGSSGISHIPPQQTLIGTLVKKAPKDCVNNQFVKTILQPRKVKKMTKPHHARYKKPYFHVTENKSNFPIKSLTHCVSVERICINHYTYRDEEFFYSEKQRRIKNWFPDSPPPQMNPEYNTMEDRTILIHLPELEKRLSLE